MSAYSKEERAAFVRGFLSGLAAPISLFSESCIPKLEKIQFTKLHKSIADPVEAMRSDWMQVGADIDVAIQQQKTKNPK